MERASCGSAKPNFIDEHADEIIGKLEHWEEPSSPSEEVSEPDRELDRAEIAQLAVKLQFRQHWTTMQIRRYIRELLEATV